MSTDVHPIQALGLGMIFKVHPLIGSQWQCSFDLKLRGKPYIRTWGTYRGPIDAEPCLKTGHGAMHLFRFWQEVDLTAVKLRGLPVRVIADLIVDDALKPAHYHVRVGKVNFDISFSGEEVQTSFHGGFEHYCRAQGDFVLAGNMPPQLDLWIRKLLATGGLPYHGRFFSPETLQAIPYSIEWRAGVLVSSLGESLLLDKAGNLSRITLPEREFSVRRVSRPLPRWRTTLSVSSRRLRYSGHPRGLSVRLVNLAIPGAAVAIGATLALPRRRKPFAGALFLPGSGRHDRHGLTETLDLGYHYFLDRMAAEGLFSLRFDRRGAGSTQWGPNPLDPGFNAVVADAEAVLTGLCERREAEGLPLILIGHSEGGLVALDIATRRTEIAGVVLLAAAGRPIDQVLAEQITRQAHKLRFSAATLNQWLNANSEFFYFVRTFPEWREETVPPAVFAKRHLRRFYAEQLTRDPCELIGRLGRPVLIIQGDRDEQVSTQDSELLRAAAERGGTPVTYQLLHGRDHLFKRPQPSGRFDAYHDRRRRPAKEIVDWIINWVSSRPAQG